MKKSLIIFAILTLNSVCGQDLLSLNPRSMIETLYFKELGTIKISDIKGSPYTDEKFTNATFADNYHPVKARYNMYADQIEFIRDEKIYILPNNFSKVDFTEKNQKLVYFTNPSSDLSGYFYEIVNSHNVKIYKKMTVLFQPPKKSTSIYTEDQSAMFTKPTTIYYILTDSVLNKIPKSSEEFSNFFPNKKEQIKRYIKDSKLKLDKETDLINLAVYIDTKL